MTPSAELLRLHQSYLDIVKLRLRSFSGSLWLYLALFCSRWLSLALFDSIWLSLALSGSLRLLLCDCDLSLELTLNLDFKLCCMTV